ncbi:MAG TPA: hypothetical protein VG842_08210 [Sediminibacterium sp.]|nr:hypothetical protein [Sediminibacterium sp.]
MHYIQDRFHEPDLVVDISPYMEQKIASVLAYGTQFYNPDWQEQETYISSPQFLESVKARALLLGKRIGVAYGEGFCTEKTVGVASLGALIQNVT